jgi:hypothetical protein
MGYLGIDLDLVTPAEPRDPANALLRAAWSATLEETRALVLELLIAADATAIWEGGMSAHSPPLRTDGDAIVDRPAPVSSDLHALPALLTVVETAELLCVGRSRVYDHAAEKQHSIRRFPPVWRVRAERQQGKADVESALHASGPPAATVDRSADDLAAPSPRRSDVEVAARRIP